MANSTELLVDYTLFLTSEMFTDTVVVNCRGMARCYLVRSGGPESPKQPIKHTCSKDINVRTEKEKYKRMQTERMWREREGEREGKRERELLLMAIVLISRNTLCDSTKLC